MKSPFAEQSEIWGLCYPDIILALETLQSNRADNQKIKFQ